MSNRPSFNEPYGKTLPSMKAPTSLHSESTKMNSNKDGYEMSPEEIRKNLVHFKKE